MEGSKAYVFVPSRGLSYLNDESFLYCPYEDCFRPLTGTLLSKQGKRITARKKKKQSFRPLTGTLLSKLTFSRRYTYSLCFRPLTGTLLSKLVLSIIPHTSHMVFVPSRGLSYLNENDLR